MGQMLRDIQGRASGELIELARQIVDGGELPIKNEEIYLDAIEDFGVSSVALSQLMDKANWLSDHPVIYLEPRINQIGNLVVSWHPVPNLITCGEGNPLLFDRLFLLMCTLYDSNRPMNELMWIRGVRGRQAHVHHKQKAQATLAIFEGIVARYNELVGQLRSSLDVLTDQCLTVMIDRKRDYIGIRVKDANA